MSQQLLSLSIEKKIGQLLFVGLPSVEIDDDARQLLEDISPGGVCLFARNIRSVEQTRNFLENIREVLPVEPLLSIDQEGGLVDRLRRIITPMSSAASIQSIGDAENLAKITGKLLRMLGFNMNLAPVVDVVDEHRAKNANGLYSRAFGDSKESAFDLAGAYLNALQNSGCLGCVKHFPGLGASEVDSHEELPVVNLTPEDLFAVDLFPYQKLFKTERVHAVMVGHASYPQLGLQERDANGKLLPSSLSFEIVTNLLRRELGFQNLVISDDLEMGAILKNYGIGEACVMAVNAGIDMVLICANAHSIRQGFNALVDAVKKGALKEARIDESLGRIAQIKSLTEPPLPFDQIRWQILAREIAELNKKVNYSYGG